jgi:hypothetical protein
MTQLITNTQANQKHIGNNGVGGSNGNSRNRNHGGNNDAGGSNGNHVEGNNNNISAQNHTCTANRVIPRPLLPRFLGEQHAGNQEQPQQVKILMIT